MYVGKDSRNRSGIDVYTVLFRGEENIFELGLDYRHLKSLMFAPTFPYRSKTDLLHAYSNGNYVYIVDGQDDIVLHPKYWHVTGVDAKTQTRVRSVKEDADMGSAKLNVSDYTGQKLGEYFRRLLKKSFASRAIDIFRAPNFGGTNRVLSVAPILVRQGQFSEDGVFGHVIIGCNVDYFEEPTEQYVPYY